MLESVKTLRDVEIIRDYVDQQFRLIENTDANQMRKRKIMEHITQVSAVKRRQNTYMSISQTP
jgi:hypothetical protein